MISQNEISLLPSKRVHCHEAFNTNKSCHNNNNMNQSCAFKHCDYSQNENDGKGENDEKTRKREGMGLIIRIKRGDMNHSY